MDRDGVRADRTAPEASIIRSTSSLTVIAAAPAHAEADARRRLPTRPRPRRARPTPTPAPTADAGPDDGPDRHAGADSDISRFDAHSGPDDPADADPGTDGQPSTGPEPTAGRVDPERAAGFPGSASPSDRAGGAGRRSAAPRPAGSLSDPGPAPGSELDVGRRRPARVRRARCRRLDRRRRLRVGGAGRDPGRSRPAPDAAHRCPGGGRIGLAAARPAQDRFVRSGAPSTGIRVGLTTRTGSPA